MNAASMPGTTSSATEPEARCDARSVHIKICGLTDLGDARAALDYGADYLGFVLVPDSPRAISHMAFLRLLDRLDEPRRAVAVVMNESPAMVRQLAVDADLQAVQLHGDEAAAEFADCPVPLWRALHAVAGALRPDPEEWAAQRFVLDGYLPGKLPGGTGQTADWTIAAELARLHPLMLAGGLNATNVAEAVCRVRPLGVDAASGIERAPGRKDFAALRAFIGAVRKAEEKL